MNHDRILKHTFMQTMLREGKIVTGYYDKKQYKVFFRRNKDNNSPKDHVTLFYPIRYSVNQGKLLRYKDKVFLTLNQETVENDVYYRSSCLRCNTKLNVVVDGYDITIPCYAADATDYNPEESSLLSAVSNAIRLITEDNQYSRAVRLNDYFEICGGAYTVSNTILKDGMVTIYMRRVQENPKNIYKLCLDAGNTYRLGETAKMIVTAFIGDKPVQNPTVEWSSDNTDIISIDQNGEVSFIGTGEATITARWVQHDTIAATTIKVVNDDIRTCRIVGDGNIVYKTSQTYRVEFERNGIADTSATPVWSLDFGDEIVLKPKVSLTDNGDGTASIAIVNNTTIIGKSFDVVVSDTTGQYSARKRVKIVQYSTGW